MPVPLPGVGGPVNDAKIIFAVLALASLSFSLDVTNCSVISSPGQYDLANDVAGAPHFDFNPTPAYACIRITGSNIVLDCHGRSIANNGTPANTFGITVQGTNITLKNCHVSNYSWGLELMFSQNSTISNVTVLNSQYSGFVVDASMHNLLTGNTACHNGGKGFETNAFFSNTLNNIFDGNTACFNGAFGFQISGLNNTLSNNMAYDNGYSGFTSGPSNLLVNNTAYNHPQVGIIAGSDIVVGNIAHDNGVAGFLADGNNSFSNNSAFNNGQGVRMGTFSSGTFFDNVFCNNSAADIYNGGSGNTGDGNTCSTALNWNDAGTTGCTFSCPDSCIVEVEVTTNNDSGLRQWTAVSHRQSPREGALVKAFDWTDPESCAAQSRPREDELGCEAVSSCTTDSSGKCIMGLPCGMNYDILVESPSAQGQVVARRSIENLSAESQPTEVRISYREASIMPLIALPLIGILALLLSRKGSKCVSVR